MSTRQKLNKKIARQIREEIAEAIHASAERIAEIRKNSKKTVHPTGSWKSSSPFPVNNSPI